MNGYKIVLLKAILCFIGCRKVNGYAPEYVSNRSAITGTGTNPIKNLQITPNILYINFRK